MRNVNALAENQSLTFIPKGVTIVYGDNGSGKSGYVRVMKQSCRARNIKNRTAPILSNIYEKNTDYQCAEFEYLDGDNILKTIWRNDQPADNNLSEISVFDSLSANVHVEKTNDIFYTPFPMKILERLAAVCDSIKTTIGEEIKRLKEHTPRSISESPCSSHTEVGKLIESLVKHTKPRPESKKIDQLAQLSDEETTRLAELTSDFSDDPKETAKKLLKQKSQIEKILDELENLYTSASIESAEKVKNLSLALKTKTKAAEIAADKNFKDEPLDGIGSEVWRMLWKAAREYSTEQAYPDKSFPVTGGNARCVLCLQDLDHESANRLQSFEAFIQDHTQQEKETADRELSIFLNILESAKLHYKKRSEYWQFFLNELGDCKLASSYREFTIRAHWRLRGILRKQANVALELPSLDDVGLNNVIDNLEARARVLLADRESEEHQSLINEHEELKDRKWLSEQKEGVIAEIERLIKIDELDTIQKKTDSKSITIKNTDLSKALVTERLRERFAEEIKKFDLGYLAVELNQENSKKGVSRFQIRLSKSMSDKVGSILSEGEFRCVALAGFLAEIAINDNKSGIIFDDPVSSLDHIYRESIAKRLANEGLNRQVIVFTHDISFLFLLKDACFQQGDLGHKTEVVVRHIQKKENRSGYCSNQPPDKAKKACDRVESMRKCLAKEKYRYKKDPNGTDWLITSRGIIDSLRQAWESAIEESISPVLCRFSNKVNTVGFINLSVIEEKDAKKMREHYRKCSDFLHDRSCNLNSNGLTPKQIECELDALDDWIRDIKARQKTIKNF